MPKKNDETKTSEQAEAAAPGNDSPLPPPTLPEAEPKKESATQHSALVACKKAGVTKLLIEVDVETALMPAESSKGQSVKVRAQVGNAFLPVNGVDIVETIQLAGERALAHPPQQDKTVRTHAPGADPTSVDSKIVGR